MGLRIEDEELIPNSGWSLTQDQETKLYGIVDRNAGRSIPWNEKVDYTTRPRYLYVEARGDKIILEEEHYHLNFNDYICTDIIELTRDSHGEAKFEKTGFVISDNRDRSKRKVHYYVNFRENPIVKGTNWRRIKDLNNDKYGIYDPKSDTLLADPVYLDMFVASDTGRSFALDEANDYYLIENKADGAENKLVFTYHCHNSNQK